MLDDLQQENSELLEFLYACPVGLIQTDLDGGMTMLNPLAMQLLLALSDGVQHTNLFDALARSGPDLRFMVHAFMPDHGQICSGHRLYAGLSSGGRPALQQVIACTIVKLGPQRLMATLEDVSERVAQERRLKQADAWFASFVDGADGFAVLGLDQQGSIDSLDDAAQRQTGFDESDLIGASLSTLDRADPATATMTMGDEIDFARRDGWHLAEGWSARKDGSRYRCQRLITVRSDTAGVTGQVAGYTVVLRPVSHHRLDAEMLRLRLTTDLLTNAYNRAYFFDVADEEIRRCVRRDRPVGLIVLDIDHFKLVNDTHGHGVGDIVLRTIASTCMAVLRPNDIFARIGGEEFAVLLPSADPDMTAETAERMRSAIAAAKIAVDQTDLHVTASLGYVAGDAANQALSTLMLRADRALYNAKRGGRNRVTSDPAASAAA